MRNSQLAFARVARSGVAWAAVFVLLPATARADAGASKHLALGAAPAWEARNDYGEGGRMNFVPELLGFFYLPTKHERYHLRTGARLGLSGLSQADMPNAVKLEEWDLRPALEVGVLRDGPVIPVLALGVGAVVRQVSLATQAPVTNVEGPQNRNELLPRGYVHLALGVPFGEGRVVVEPFGRYEIIVGDTRSAWRFGIDLSVLLF